MLVDVESGHPLGQLQIAREQRQSTDVELLDQAIDKVLERDLVLGATLSMMNHLIRAKARSLHLVGRVDVVQQHQLSRLPVVLWHRDVCRPIIDQLLLNLVRRLADAVEICIELLDVPACLGDWRD